MAQQVATSTVSSPARPALVVLSVIDEEVLGDGASGEVYIGEMRTSGIPGPSANAKVVALKTTHVTRYVLNPVLRHEAAILVKLRGHRSVPEVYAWGKSRLYEYLALELLGGNILEAISSTGPLTLRNLVALSCQMLDAIEHVHSHGLVHGDIKPDHFIFGQGPGPKAGQRYLIDYGLATRYKHRRANADKTNNDENENMEEEENEHVKPYVLRDARGTIDYAGINMHLRRSPSRADDMESLSYTLIRLLRGSLPWSSPDMSHWPTEVEILNQKIQWSGMDLYRGYGGTFAKFMDYCRGLGFEEKPDYSAWKGRFLALISGLVETPLYEPADESTPPIEPTPPASSTTPPAPNPSHPPLIIPDPQPYVPELPDEDDGWYPVDSGRLPYIIRAEDVLDDEKEIVRRHVERIGEVPEMKRRIHFNKEEMLTEEEEDEDEERFGGPWVEGVYNPVDH